MKVIVNRATNSATMAVVTESGARYTLQSSPTGFDSNEVAEFGQAARQGSKAVTRKVGPGLATHSFTHTVSSADHTKSIESVVVPLRNLARDGAKVRFVGGSVNFEQGKWWHIKGLTVSAVRRSLDNNGSRFELSWSLEEAVDVTATIVKIVPPPPPPAPPAPPVRTYRVVPGDCLWYIAQRFLGNGARWPEIYNMNRAVVGGNPNLIFPGQIFRIP